MIWGCMTAKGFGYASGIDGRMDAELYTRILGDELFKTIEHYKLEANNIIFQQDNDPKHTSRAASYGSRTTKSRCWSGLHSPQISIPPNISGFI